MVMANVILESFSSVAPGEKDVLITTGIRHGDTR